MSSLDVQRPQEKSQNPAIHGSLHLSHAACCWQEYVEVGASSQQPPSHAGAGAGSGSGVRLGTVLPFSSIASAWRRQLRYWNWLGGCGLGPAAR